MTDEKTLCVMGLVDQVTNRNINLLKAHILESGCTPDVQEAHVTFGIYSGIDKDELVQWIQSVHTKLKRIPLYYSHIGFFSDSGVCFAAPCVNKRLLEFHEIIHSMFDDYCYDKACLYSLHSERWVPHTTLAILQNSDYAKILPGIIENFIPFAGELIELKITEYQPMRDICSFDLNY